jgi:aminoglycoside 6'-N-acetyltransferase I
MATRFHIRPVLPDDADAWVRLRTALWPDGAADHPGEIAAFFAGTAPEPLAAYVAECHGQAVAILELSIRTDLLVRPRERVGYVEELYIVPEFRRCALARQLLRTAEGWAREQRCAAVASDRAGRIILAPHYRPR